MSISSNLYAEKVFAEHPIVLWPLDDSVDYVSLISEDQRDFSGDTWQISGGTASLNYSLNSPFDDSHTTEFNTAGADAIILMTGQAVSQHGHTHPSSPVVKPAGTPSPAGTINPTLKAVPM